MTSVILSLIIAANPPRLVHRGWQLPLAIGFGLGVLMCRAKPREQENKQPSSQPLSFNSRELNPQPSQPNERTLKDGKQHTPAAKTPAATTWTANLIKQTSLIWGNQGGGKSWLARYAVTAKLAAGYRVVVLDPDSNPSEWVGVESHHSWEAIEAQIRWYNDELNNRLAEFNSSTMNDEQWQEKLLADGRAVALVVEEATTYGSFISDTELLDTFGKLALTKSRKQLMPITVVAHNNTISCLFGIKGLGNLVSKMLQVQCLAAVNPETLKPQSTGKCKVKLDSSLEWLDAELPNMTEKITKFSEQVVKQPAKTPPETPPPAHDPKCSTEALTEAIVNSFSGKGTVKLSRMVAGCNRLRVCLGTTPEAKVLRYLIDKLVADGKAKWVEDSQDNQAEPTDFLIV